MYMCVYVSMYIYSYICIFDICVHMYPIFICLFIYSHKSLLIWILSSINSILCQCGIIVAKLFWNLTEIYIVSYILFAHLLSFLLIKFCSYVAMIITSWGDPNGVSESAGRLRGNIAVAVLFVHLYRSRFIVV